MSGNLYFDPHEPLSVTNTCGFKVTLCGVGAVGCACAYSLINQNIVSEIVLVDVIVDKLQGETMDFQHGGAYFQTRVRAAGSDYLETANSDLCIITSGVRQREGESRLSLCSRNVDVLRSIVPQIVAKSPNVVFLVVSNPCDIMSYVTWKLSGLPASRILGSGTSLDSSRFRLFIAEKLGVHPKSVQADIIGEHGDSSVAVWSSANISGVKVNQVINDREKSIISPEAWNDIHKEVINAAMNVIKKKGYTNWAIGVTVAHIVAAIRQNTREVIPVSVYAKGCYGIEQEVFLSIPSVIYRHGIENKVHIPLNAEETKALQTCADTLYNIQKEINV